MKKITKLALMSIIAFGAVLFPHSMNAAPARDAAAKFNDVEGKEWLLSELKTRQRTITLDRQKLAIDNLVGIYSASFQEGRLAGMGAPNRYTAPYTIDANRSINIGLVASTMMLAFREPDELKEREFFDYLSRVKRWDLAEGKLELHSSNSNGSEVVLIFNSK